MRRRYTLNEDWYVTFKNLNAYIGQYVTFKVFRDQQRVPGDDWNRVPESSPIFVGNSYISSSTLNIRLNDYAIASKPSILDIIDYYNSDNMYIQNEPRKFFVELYDKDGTLIDGETFPSISASPLYAMCETNYIGHDWEEGLHEFTRMNDFNVDRNKVYPAWHHSYMHITPRLPMSGKYSYAAIQVGCGSQLPIIKNTDITLRMYFYDGTYDEVTTAISTDGIYYIPVECGDYVRVDLMYAANDGLHVYTVAKRDDSCGSRYYLQWIDRVGFFQCQPFSANTKFTEQFKYTDIKDMNGNVRKCNIDVQEQWVLNSDWLTNIEREEYESIMLSPLVWLYDMKTDITHRVYASDTSYEEKKIEKEKSLIRMTVTVKAAKEQNQVL